MINQINAFMWLLRNMIYFSDFNCYSFRIYPQIGKYGNQCIMDLFQKNEKFKKNNEYTQHF